MDERVSRTATETETLSRGVYATFHTRVVLASVPPTARKLPSSCLGTRARVAPNMTSYGQGKVPEEVLELRARAATRDVDLFFLRVTRTHAHTQFLWLAYCIYVYIGCHLQPQLVAISVALETRKRNTTGRAVAIPFLPFQKAPIEQTPRQRCL